MDVKIPAKCGRVLWDKHDRRYRVLHGGRGSAKSWSAVRYLILEAAKKKLRILCTREIQNSIRDSVYRLLVDQIAELGLGSYFYVKFDTIVAYNGSEFLFKGLQKNINEIKSTEGIDVCFVEEAERVSENSWDNLIPTIRKEGSFLIIVFNPEDEKSATYTKFVWKEGGAADRPDIISVAVNYFDNPFFPEVLRKEMEWDKKNDPDKYEHVWMGNPKKYGDAVIFKNKIVVEEFETPDGEQFFFGADFGYANDPSGLWRMHIRDKKLWIDYEAYGVGVELDELHPFFAAVPAVHDWEIVADSARPETISHLSRPTKDGLHRGFNIKGAAKGKGSVEDGIAFLRGFEAIVIHPRCRGAIDNFNNYRWKKDKITDAILPIPVDKSNHACLAGNTKILMGDGKGIKEIRDIAINDLVMTSQGRQKVLSAGMTKKEAEVKEYEFSNGVKIIATPDHPVFTLRGSPCLDACRYSDIIRAWRKSYLITRSIDGMEDIIHRLAGVKMGGRVYTGQFGKAVMEKFLKVIISTIKTARDGIIESKTWKYFLLKNTLCCISGKNGKSPNSEKELKTTWRGSGHLQKNGIVPRKDENGTESMERKHSREEQAKDINASVAENNIDQRILEYPGFAQTPVNQNGEGGKGSMTLKRIAQFAAKVFCLISIPKYQPVRLVAARSLTIKIDVYNLAVESARNYYANGILVSNCDAIRYGLEDYMKSGLSMADIL